MRIITAAPVIPKVKPITGTGDAKQLSPSFTNLAAAQPNNGAGYFYSSDPGSEAARAASYPTIGQTPAKKTPVATTTKTSPTTTDTSSTTTTAPATQSIYDLSTDPIVQKIRSLNTSNYGQSVADADTARKQALINAGFADLARASQFGSLENPTTGDQATALAAQANPFSIAAQLANAHAQALQGIDQAAAQNNTYFGSARGNQIGNEGRTYLGNVTSAEGALRQQLANILSGLVSAKGSEQQAEADAISQARQNAITNAESSGQTFVGYDSNGNPIFSTPGATTTTPPADPVSGVSVTAPNPGPPDSAGRDGAAPAVTYPAQASNAAKTILANAVAAKQKQLIDRFG